MKTPLILALATAAGLPLASAQEERRPENPPRPPDAERAPVPRPDGPRERRPDGDRPSVEPADRRPDGDRGPGQRRVEGQPSDAPRAEGRRPDGDRREGQRPEGDRRGGQRFEGQVEDPGRDRRQIELFATTQRPQKPTAYLGVVTAPVAPELAAQLGLPEGFGLVVEEVIPDSPAARAGVQRFDVLKLLNDQQLIDPNQLAALVRRAGNDAEVSLTVLRKGGEQKLSVKVGERMLPERRPMTGGSPLLPNPPMREHVERGARELQERAEKWKSEYGVRMQEFNERMKEYGNRMREFHERASKGGPNPGGAVPQPPKPPEPPAPPRFDSSFEPAPAPADVLKLARPGGAAGIRVENQDGNVTVWNTANAHVVMKTDAGEMELSSANGKRTVTARGPDGTVTFSGPIDTEEQRAALPEAVRKQLDRMDVRSTAQPGATSAALNVYAAPEVVAFDLAAPTPEGEREVQ